MSRTFFDSIEYGHFSRRIFNYGASEREGDSGVSFPALSVTPVHRWRMANASVDIAGTTAAGTGDPIGHIADEAGTQPLAAPSSGARPVLRQTGGTQYAEHDGVDDRLVVDLPSDITVPTYWLVYRSRDAIRTQYLLGSTEPGTTSRRTVLLASGSNRTGFCAGGQEVIESPRTTDWQTSALARDDTAPGFYVARNGVILLSPNTSATGSIPGLVVGSRLGGGLIAKMDWCELVLFAAPPTAQDIADLYAYAKAAYGDVLP